MNKRNADRLRKTKTIESNIIETKQTNDRFVHLMKQFLQVASTTYSFIYLFYDSQESTINYQKLHH